MAKCHKNAMLRDFWVLYFRIRDKVFDLKSLKYACSDSLKIDSQGITYGSGVAQSINMDDIEFLLVVFQTRFISFQNCLVEDL